MAEFKFLPLAKIKANQKNPRIISESKLKKLINSLLVFPKMMVLRPITVDENSFVLGGNMRQTALGRIANMTFEELKAHLETLPEFNDLPNDGREVLEFWEQFLDNPKVRVQIASTLTDEEKKQFIIKDNVSFGDWDYDELENWDSEKLDSWGLDTSLPDFGNDENSQNWGGQENEKERTITETEKLSEVEFIDAYYQPKLMPDITLRDCINTELFDKKMEFIESLNLPCEMQETMRMLSYRFIRIDFEAVANYYAFNANDEEKRAIERLRLVLVDGAIDGFIGDNLLKVYQHFSEKYDNNKTEDEDEEND